MSLTDESVVSFTHIEGVQPPVTFEEFMACEAVVQADPDWQAAMRLRGVEDFSLAMIDPWAAGLQRAGGRPGRAPDRPAADVAARRAGRARLRAADRGPDRRRRPRRDGGDRGRRPRRRRAPAQGRQLRPGADGATRTTSRPSRRRAADLKPIEITQPEGASFTVSGHGVAWQKWHVRVGFTPREGLVLHELSYETGRGRSSTARRWPRCTCPTATPRPRTASRTSSTRASTASAGSPTR